MFPRSFLFFIFLIVMDIILKSIKDKQKIEKARSKRREQLSRQPGDMQSTVSPSREKRKSIEKPRPKYEPIKERVVPLKDERRTEAQPVNEEIYISSIYRQEIQSPIEKKVKGNKIKKSKDQFKNDILKGIIYSEILSEPKSLRNIRKSI
ncbi:hypothetical protein [Clostridium sp. Cult2]|uniref:hypothetical protein n=1 Tax=Clostridium sp. Cult2 TaxID=2079003 RepID=UPI001F443300|nr:hypothetical protein [Clostridium sp. Cult2]MCF6466526.1 hypothetical protein [Clostridium sp. Cult2]